MKKTNKIALIVVLVLVVAFGVGQFFAYSNLNSASSDASSTAAAPVTQVTYYAPPAITSSTPIEKGSCWTNSIAAPYRSDAWRCAVGNGIQDPCFQIGDTTDTLMCNVDPAISNDSSSFALELTSPLPTPEAVPTSTGANTAWLIQLQGGTLCSPFTGTLPPVTEAGQTANYGCAPGPLGSDVVIFGSLNSASNLWAANVAELSTSTKIFPPVIVSSSSVPVEEVWE